MGDPEDPPQPAEPTAELTGAPAEQRRADEHRRALADQRDLEAKARAARSEESTDDVPVDPARLTPVAGSPVVSRGPLPTPSTGSKQLSNDPTEVLADAPPAAAPAPTGPYLPPLLARTWVDVDLPLVDAENYERLGEHARGGLGRIVKARDKRTGRVVALKEMMGGSQTARQRFTREALITANLQHPSIIPVYELGRWTNGEPFYAMKLVSGRSLAEVLKGATFDQRLARVPVIQSVAEALAYAHERRIVHRDLKPANVLVGEFGETVVIDWGLAKSVDEIGDTDVDIDRVLRPRGLDPTMVGAVVGTPAYMSPEQARGESVDERSDVYAIGAMLYHVIAGHRPYFEVAAKTSREIVDLVAAGAPAPLGAREAGTPPELITIVNKAMARERDHRYPNAGKLADDLQRFLTGQLVAAHHYNRRTLFLRWLKRHRAPVTVGAILATLLVVTGALGVRGVLVERDRVREQRDIARQETVRAEKQVAAALFEKGRVAETAHEWPKAALYYAAARTHHDTPRAAWAAGLAAARAVTPMVRYEGHKGAWVHAVALSPDGSKAATVDDTGWVRVWSPVDGKTLGEVKAGTVPLYAVAFSPDGTEIAIAGDDGVIQRRSLDSTLSVRGTLAKHTGRIWSLAYSPDGALLASGGEDAKVKLWDITSGTARTLSGHAQRVYSVVFSADGKRLASGSDDRHVWQWDVATGLGGSRGNHMAGGIRVVMFTGDTLVTTGWDHEIRVWPGDGKTPGVWSDSHIVHGAALDPSGELLVTAGESEMIRIWDLSTHKLVTSLDAAGGQTSAVAFSRDGSRFITAGKTPPIAWDARPLARMHGVGHREDVVALEVTNDGTKLLSGSTDKTIRVWDLASARELRRITTSAYCSDGIALLPGDDLIASCDDHVIRRWDRTGTVRELKTPTWLRFLSISPDGASMAAGHVDGLVSVIDLATWSFVTTKKLHAHHIYDITYANDGRLVTASLDDHVRTWRGRELADDLDVVTGSDDGVLAGALLPDGSQLAAGGQDGVLRVWDTAKSAFRVQRKDLAFGTVWMLRITPDGKHAVTAHDDGGVRIWDTATWDAPVLMQAEEGTALSIAVTPDSRTVIAGYKSGAIVIWDLTTHQVRARIGGNIRDRGSCAELTKQIWHDADHAATVEKACTSAAAAYFTDLAKRSHQRIDEGVDVRWEWAEPAK